LLSSKNGIRVTITIILQRYTYEIENSINLKGKLYPSEEE
jgi:hypothetical protein